MMHIIVAGDSGDLVRSTLSSLPNVILATLTTMSGDDLIQYEAQPGDIIVVYVEGLADVSTALSMLELLIAGVVAQVALITELELDALFSYADRWEASRFDELIESERLLVVGASSDWQSLLTDRLFGSL